MLAVAVFAVVVAHPTFDASFPAVTGFAVDNGNGVQYLFPVLFTTVACGAIDVYKRQLMMVHKKEETLYAQLSSVNASLNEAMNNIRESVHDLHDESVDLKQAVVEATSQMRQNYELQLVYDMSCLLYTSFSYALTDVEKPAENNRKSMRNKCKNSKLYKKRYRYGKRLVQKNGILPDLDQKFL